MATNVVQAMVRPEPDATRPERTKTSGEILPFKTEKVDAAVHFINERTWRSRRR